MQSASLVRPSPEALRFLRSAVAAQSRVAALPLARISASHQRNRYLSAAAKASPPCRRTASPRSHSKSRFSSSSSPLRQAAAPTLPSNPESHYDFFPATLPDGPPPAGAFAVDLAQLRAEFLRLQAAAHPDRHRGAGKARAEALSARINEAYRTLRSPLLRAQYLLERRGAAGSVTDDAAKLGDGGDGGEQALLMEVLELRERIEEAETEGEVEEMRGENDARIGESVRVLGEAFEGDRLAEAAREAVRLRYWVNVDETLRAWEEGKPAPLLQH